MPTEPRLIVALGSFDGVHLGHQQIIATAHRLAAELDATPGVLTYDPLPAQVIYEDFTYILTPLAEKKLLLAELGVEYICVLRFDAILRDTPAETFVREHLLGRLHPAAVVIGHDHRFGARGKGDADLLRTQLEPLGIKVAVVPEILLDDVPLRSTSIREHLLLGHVRLAARLLGRPYSLAGTIVPGTGTGRKLGFPTINLRPYERETLVPADGVYACEVDAMGRQFRAVLNIGHRPTFGGETRTIEAHLLEARLETAPTSAVFRLVDRIRPERRFDSPQALSGQIESDIVRARLILANPREISNLDVKPASNSV
jgi:riboflavin kinase/FMN adenylyltransferase